MLHVVLTIRHELTLLTAALRPFVWCERISVDIRPHGRRRHAFYAWITAPVQTGHCWLILPWELWLWFQMCKFQNNLVIDKLTITTEWMTQYLIDGRSKIGSGNDFVPSSKKKPSFLLFIWLEDCINWNQHNTSSFSSRIFTAFCMLSLRLIWPINIIRKGKVCVYGKWK